MKVAVVGCGAVGSYYGARLAQSGHEVHFLLRTDYEAVRANGVRVRSPQDDFHVRPRCAKAPAEIGESDLVLIGLKTTANDQFPNLLPPLVGSTTAILTLQNGLGNEEQLARSFKPEQILGGLCFVCLNRLAPGLIQHIAHGKVVIGEFQRPAERRTHDLVSALQLAGVACKATENLARAHWEKLVWNIPFNGLGVAGSAGIDTVLEGRLPAGFAARDVRDCLTTDRLLDSRRWEELVRELMREVVVSAAALGFDIPAELPEQQIGLTRSMGPYKASTLLDFEQGRPLELQSLFLEPLRQARNAGAKTPRLAALATLLPQLDALRTCPAQGHSLS